jgi:hypothetical protein
MNSSQDVVPVRSSHRLEWISLICGLVGIPWVYFVGGFLSFAFFYTEGPPTGNIWKASLVLLIAGTPSFAAVFLAFLAIYIPRLTNQFLIPAIIGLVSGVLGVAVLLLILYRVEWV